MKREFCLVENSSAFIRSLGRSCGFLTLTFADDVQCAREASRRFNSFRTNTSFLNDYICVQERQKNGRIHYHVLVSCPFEWPVNFDFDAQARRDYRHVPKCIRNFWRKLLVAARAHGFGRTELMPVRSAGAGRYLAKYLAKGQRHPLDKGVRLVRYSSSVERVARPSFSWITPYSCAFGVALDTMRELHPFANPYRIILNIKRVFDENHWDTLFSYFETCDRSARANLLRGYLRRVASPV